MSANLRVTYVGPDEALRDKTALAMESYCGEPAPEGMLYLQFDDLSLELDGVNLAHGWHAFRKDLLTMDRPEMTEDWCHCGCGLTLTEVKELDPHA